jgi:hypothetical protein
MLHSVDRPLVGARYGDDTTLIPTTAPSFYHWQRDTEAIAAAYAWLVEGLCFDIQYNDLWLENWGAKPSMREAQEARVQDLVQAAPKLIPVFGHRYLLAEPWQAGNPVLSIYQSDIVVYSSNLHDYLLMEFGDLIGGVYTQLTPSNIEAYQTIPFWGDFVS